MSPAGHALFYAMVGFASLMGSKAVATPCPEIGTEQADVIAVEPRLELNLRDGRRVRVAGLDPALQTPTDPDLAEAARARLAAMVAGKRITLAPLAASPDRWGRIPAFVFERGGPSAAGGLAGRAIAAGLGRYLAEPTAHACREALLAAEQTARAGKLGLWADPYYAVLAVDDRAGVTERSGTIVLAEGRLSAVQPSPYRTILRFAAPGSDSRFCQMLVATIPPRVMKTFDAQRMNVRALIGQRVRFRGMLDLRFGPRIELATPDELETVFTPLAGDSSSAQK